MYPPPPPRARHEWANFKLEDSGVDLYKAKGKKWELTLAGEEDGADHPAGLLLLLAHPALQ
jgi:hypothetical protein